MTSRIPVLFLQELLRTVENSDQDLSISSVRKARVRILDLLIQLAVDSEFEETALKLFSRSSTANGLIVSAISEDAAERLDYLRKQCQEVFRAPHVPIENIADFLQEKTHGIAEKQKRLAGLVQQHDQLAGENVHLLQTTVDLLGKLIEKNQLDMANEVNDGKFSALLKVCDNFESSQLQVAKWTLMQQYYTVEKIAQLRQSYENSVQKKMGLEADLAAANTTKSKYESMGPELAHLAKVYVRILRDIEMHHKILTAGPSTP